MIKSVKIYDPNNGRKLVLDLVFRQDDKTGGGIYDLKLGPGWSRAEIIVRDHNGKKVMFGKVK